MTPFVTQVSTDGHRNHQKFFDICTTLAKGFVTSHSLSQSPQILKGDDCNLIT